MTRQKAAKEAEHEAEKKERELIALKGVCVCLYASLLIYLQHLLSMELSDSTDKWTRDPF